ncbi:NXPE family member 4-like [Anolis sagrei]|uniref:NXPE family member 4-like n=1 Tax=Anolis sagrei TaxID=38937 RepID=UPI003521B35D
MPTMSNWKHLFIVFVLVGAMGIIYIPYRNSYKMGRITSQAATEQQAVDIHKCSQSFKTKPVSVSDGSSGYFPLQDGLLNQIRMGWIKKKTEREEILAKLDQLMPHVTFSDINKTTSAKNSRATILNPKDSYCVGEDLMVQLDLYDRSGNRKKHGGDFLRARIYSSSLKAGASGNITDFGNGTFLVNFTLFWEGDTRVSLLLIHPSEGVSALWAARKKGYNKIAFTGKFLNGTSEVTAECGFNMTRKAELCEYLDERDQEAFFCLKPKHVPCAALVQLKSYDKPISYLTDLERSLLERSNVGVEIPHMFEEIHVLQCGGNQTKASEKCQFGMSPQFPSGFLWQNQWYPLFCNMSPFNTLEQIQACLKGKLVYFMGDSTVRQWMENLKKRLTSLVYLNIHNSGRPQKLIAVDTAKNILIQWKKHGHPYIGTSEYSIKDHSYIARDMDTIAGDRDTALVISLGQHFRPFPLELFIQRAINVRRAIQRLLLRSPGTRVLIKGENTREMDGDQEKLSDFHGYVQNLATKELFQDLNVGFIDAWDMTVAYNTQKVHPPDSVVWSEILMFLNYVC